MTRPSHHRHYLEFVRLFNDEKFFEAHEALELLWREEKGEPRNFYHGLIQIAAAFVHLQKGTPDGARKLFQSASRYLEKFPSPYLGLDKRKLLSETGRCLLEEAQPPKIYLH